MNQELRTKNYAIKIAGEAGMGIKSTGLSLCEYLNSLGYYLYNYVEYPSLIRGGHNVSQIIFSENPVRSPRQKSLALLAFDQLSLDLHVSEIISGGFAICDSESDLVLPKNDQINFITLPLQRFAREAKVGDIGQNTVALGALVFLLGGELKNLTDQIETQFKSKPDFIESNQKALQSGFDYCSQNFPNLKSTIIHDLQSTKLLNLVLDGNDSTALGAISGNLDFCAIYPMSPISNMLHYLAKNKEKYGYILKQVEDEISAVNMSIGASYAGARVLTATSGGGFALMAEALGLAGMTETPLVIVEGMRGAPATGLPTWSEQGDLRFVLHAHQGDFPRIVLTPGDNQEIFEMTHQALNLATKYQCPVIILTDKNICDHAQSVQIDNSNFSIDLGQIVTDKQENYQRYQITPNGISPRALPGTGTFFVTNSDEHDEKGFDSEEIDNRNAQQSKRLQKIKSYENKDLFKPVLHGSTTAEITLVGWGSTKGPILDALADLPNVNFLQIRQVSPFPNQEVTEVLSKAKHIINIENNSDAQMAGLIREKTGIEIKDLFLKNDGRPFFPEEIITKINNLSFRT